MDNEDNKDELESQKAQEVITLLLNDPDSCQESLSNVNVEAEESIIVEEAKNNIGSSSLSVCQVSLDNDALLLKADDVLQPVDQETATSMQLEEGCALIQSFEAVDESSGTEVAKFVDGQAVQLEDGTTAFIHSIPGEGLQPIQLEDGTMAYLSQSGRELFAEEASMMDLENLAASQSLMEVNDEEEKECSKKKSKVSCSKSLGDSKASQKAFKCQYDGCLRQFTTFHHLKVHERSHTGDKPFKCSYGCGKAFATGYGLKSHTRIHTGETPYKCLYGICSKAFKTSGDLQKHVRTHTGERPFKCPFDGCNRAFTTSNIRKVHIRTHTGERPYVCDVEGCGYAFASATNLKNHTRIHTGEKPYVCSVAGCKKRFTEYSSLYKHHVVHTYAKPYTCYVCGKMYRQTSTLALHKRTVHGIVDSSADNDTADSSSIVQLASPKKSSDAADSSAAEVQSEHAEVEGNEASTPEASSQSKETGNKEIKVLTSSVKTKQTAVKNTTGSSVEPKGEESLNQNFQEQAVYAVQVQDGSSLFSGSMQQVVLITDPQQIAALQELMNQGQLEHVVTIKSENASATES